MGNRYTKGNGKMVEGMAKVLCGMREGIFFAGDGIKVSSLDMGFSKLRIFKLLVSGSTTS
jgi:hypothetical protein